MNILISRLTLLIAVSAFAQSADQDPMALAAHAYQLQQSGDYDGAAADYRAFLRLRPNEVGAHSNLGVVLTKLGRFDEAIEEYKQAETLLPADPRIKLNLALAYEKSGRLPEAVTRLEALHQSLPQEKQITMLLADARLQAGNNDRVIELLQPLEQQSPDDMALSYLLGTALIRQKRIGDGQVVLDRILKNGDTAEARFLLGMQMYEAGDYPASVKQFAAAAEVNPKLPELQTYYGEALLTTGDADAAQAAFTKELHENPNDYSANLALGQILTVRKTFDKGEPLLRQALLMRPDSFEAKVALGECLGGVGKLAEARQLLLAAVRQVPGSAQAHLQLARVDEELRLTKEAQDEKAAGEQLQQLADSQSPVAGPKKNEVAPDFTLPDAATGKRVSLRDFYGKTPVVLIFGSQSCPNFRASAESLKALQAKYGAQAIFLLIYIREAHAADSWQSTRNQRDGVDVQPAQNLSEKQSHALMCSRSLHLPFPALLDGMDNRVEAAYGAWPSRAFVIDRSGRVRYSTRLTELDFSKADMETSLKQSLNK